MNPSRLEPADHFTKKLPPGDVTQPDVRLDPVGTKEVLYKLEREGEREGGREGGRCVIRYIIRGWRGVANVAMVTLLDQIRKAL